MNTHNTGIYKITNTVNGQYYIGSAVNIKSRFKVHRSALRNGNHYSSYLQRAWNKYGKSAFEFAVILFCDKENLLFYEQRAINTYKACHRSAGYNRCPVAGNCLGKPHSEATKKKISKANTGQFRSEVTKMRISQSLKGHPALMGRDVWNKGKSGVYSEESKQRMSEAHKGQIPWMTGRQHTEETKQKLRKARSEQAPTFMGKSHSEETRKKISESLMGNTPWNKGGTFSEESRQKMSESAKGRRHSLETRQKLSALSSGRVYPDEWRRKISEGKKGKPCSEETKLKISLTKKRKREQVESLKAR